MKLRVVHRTVYTYAQPVSSNTNELRLKPVSSHGQNCDAFDLTITPSSRVSDYVDFYFRDRYVPVSKRALIAGVAAVLVAPLAVLIWCVGAASR